MKFQYIPEWTEMNLTCQRCGSNKSVKYKVFWQGKEEYWCNKCVFEEFIDPKKKAERKMEEFLKIVEPVYKKDPYRLKLAIQYHIWELYNRQCKLLSEGKDGLEDYGYQKELMDLFILLSLWIKFNNKQELFFERQQRFVEHISKMKQNNEQKEVNDEN